MAAETKTTKTSTRDKKEQSEVSHKVTKKAPEKIAKVTETKKTTSVEKEPWKTVQQEGNIAGPLN